MCEVGVVKLRSTVTRLFGDLFSGGDARLSTV